MSLNFSMKQRHPQPTFLSFFSGKLLSVKTTTFSNLPYSTFKTNTLLNNSPVKVKTKYSRFRFRNTIVSLRAPKHFKVGRQHYSLGSRFGYFNFINKNDKISMFSDNAELTSVVLGVYDAVHAPVQQPLTSIKSIKTEVCLQFRVNPIV